MLDARIVPPRAGRGGTMDGAAAAGPIPKFRIDRSGIRNSLLCSGRRGAVD